MANAKIKTYNIDVGDDTIIVEQAAGVSVTHSGALILTGVDGSVVRAYNKESWKEVWRV